MSQIWERQDNEPTLWFSRFQRFLALGRERSLLGLYNAVRREKAGKDGKPFKVATSTPGAWDEAAKKWNWRKRAEAYDLTQLKQEFGDMELMILTERKRRLKIYDDALGKIAKRLETVDLNEVSLQQLIAALRILSVQQRADLNDTPEQRPPQTEKPRRITRIRAVISDTVVAEYDSPQNDL